MSKANPTGIIGLGLMGRALAQRLVASGHAVLGFDIDATKRAAFSEIGGRAAASIPDLVAQCDRILLAVFDTGQVEDVVENHIIPALSDTPRIALCTSTCDPDRIERLAARTKSPRFVLVEAPVSGTSEQVRQGSGVVLTGGDLEAVEKSVDVLDAIFPKRFHMGAAGNGGRAKLAINLILGLNRLALAEGLVFAEKMGLDPAAFLDVARQAASYSQVMDTKGTKMVRADFSPQGKARQTLKDVRLMLDQAEKAGQILPLATVNADVLEACVQAGEGDDDNSVVIQEIRRRTRP